VGEVNGDGGCKGRTIGNKDICEQCLAELKYLLEGIKAKSPSTREASENDDDSEENELDETKEENDACESLDDPFSSSPKC
jgi:hypothetical protein